MAAKSQPACSHGGQDLQPAPPPPSPQRCFSNRIVSKLLPSAASAVGEGIWAQTAARSFTIPFGKVTSPLIGFECEVVAKRCEKHRLLDSAHPKKSSSNRMDRCGERARLLSFAQRARSSARKLFRVRVHRERGSVWRFPV